MTYKTRFKEIEKIIENKIALNDKVLTDCIDDLENSPFLQGLLSEKILYKRILDMMKIVEYSETIEEFYQNLKKENYIPERID
mgnify:CR=1 FL=1